MEQKLVKDLQSLVPKLQGDGGVSNAAEMRQATTLLTQLAKLLHEKCESPLYTFLPSLLDPCSPTCVGWR